MNTAPPPTKRRKTTTQPTLDACWSRHGIAAFAVPSLVEECLATLVMNGHADAVPESLRWRLKRLVAEPGTEPREPCGVCESTRCDGTACLQCQNVDGEDQCDNLRPCGDDGVPTDEYCARCRDHWERHRGALPMPYDACWSVACGDAASD